MKRVFDETTKGQFDKAIDDSGAEINWFLGIFDDWFQQNPDINDSQYQNNIQKYYEDLFEHNDVSKKKIAEIFEQVEKVDKEYAQKFADLQMEVAMYKHKTCALREAVRPVNGVPVFESKDFSAMMDKMGKTIFGAEIQAVLDEYGKDEKWLELLKKPNDQMSEAEYAALAYIYSNLTSEKDIEAFLKACCVKTDDYHQYNSRRVYKLEYSKWEPDEEKINKIMHYNSGLIMANVAIQEYLNSNQVTRPELASLYEQLFPGQSAGGKSFEELQKAVKNKTTEITNSRIQKDSLLRAFVQTGDNKSTRAYEGFIGKYKDDGGPTITISYNSDGDLELNKQFISSFRDKNSFGREVLMKEWQNITIHSTRLGAGAGEENLQTIKSFLLDKYSFSADQVWRDSIIQGVFDIGKSSVFSAFFPGKMGPVSVSSVISNILSKTEKGNEAIAKKQQELDQANAIIESWTTSNYVSRFQLNYNLITSKDNSSWDGKDSITNHKGVLTPSYLTIRILNCLNKELKTKITIDDVIERPKYVQEILNKELDEQEMDSIFVEALR